MDNIFQKRKEMFGSREAPTNSVDASAECGEGGPRAGPPLDDS